LGRGGELGLEQSQESGAVLGDVQGTMMVIDGRIGHRGERLERWIREFGTLHRSGPFREA